MVQAIRRWALLETAVALLLICSPRTALAHGVWGDPDPGRNVYVLPGALVSPGLRPCCSPAYDFLDVGVEVSAHRFVPKSGGPFTQLGYGALVQAQLGSIRLGPRPEEFGKNLRVAIGGQGTWGVFGLQGGLVIRAGSATFGSAAGIFAGVFVSSGLASFGAQLEVPVVAFGDTPRMPFLVTFPCTVKWIIPIRVSK